MLNYHRPKNNSTESEIKNPPLGKLRGVYHVEFSIVYFLPFIVLLTIPLIGFYIFWSVKTGFQKIASLVFTIIFTLPLIFVIWKILSKVRDELRIYEKGFTYTTSQKLQTCLWSEIKDGGFSQEFDGRSVMNSAVKKNGEKIIFAYKMRGLDKLNSLYDEEVFRQIDEEEEKHPVTFPVKNTIQNLGELQNVYHVKYGFGQIILHGFVFLPFLFFTLGIFLDPKDAVITLPVCVLPLGILAFAMLRSTFQDRNDELGIYQNGLIYQSRKGMQTCLWNEITDSRHRKWDKIITDIKTENGEWINFANAMNGLDDLTARTNKQLQ